MGEKMAMFNDIVIIPGEKNGYIVRFPGGKWLGENYYRTPPLHILSMRNLSTI
jgi:hypothetical protein